MKNRPWWLDAALMVDEKLSRTPKAIMPRKITDAACESSFSSGSV
jgi:hypothetical protein